MIIIGIVAGYFLFLSPARASLSTTYVVQFIRNSKNHQNWAVKELTNCQGAPFILPTSGLIGYLWDDSFKIGKRHQGIDIFAGENPGVTPVYAAYDGYLTRLEGWKSSVIIRIPSDPLHPGTQIWTYYTHMADENGFSFIAPSFTAGTQEKYVKAGTLLGYQGNYSGTNGKPVGVHLHFSIIKDDGSGHYLNELDIANTLDPSPYLGLILNKNLHPSFPILCENNP